MRLVWSVIPPEDTPQARLAAYPEAPSATLRCQAVADATGAACGLEEFPASRLDLDYPWSLLRHLERETARQAFQGDSCDPVVAIDRERLRPFLGYFVDMMAETDQANGFEEENLPLRAVEAKS